MPDKIAPSTPYVAPGLPRSPKAVALAGLISAAVAVLAIFTGHELKVSSEVVAALASGIVGLVGWLQHRGARLEQEQGVPKLKQERDALPPGALPADSMTGDRALRELAREAA